MMVVPVKPQNGEMNDTFVAKITVIFTYFLTQETHAHTINTWVCADAEGDKEMEEGDTVKSRANKSPTTPLIVI